MKTTSRRPTATTPSIDSDLPQDRRWHDPRWRSRVRRRLLDWFGDHARRLPWRGSQDRYRVWLSEVMLQQTQVVTVIPYFERFIKRFPTVFELAAADEASVMQLWEGLGYYRRARQLHAAAKRIVEQHDGVFPADFQSVLSLPGIGRYTAGAVLSIADGQRLPIVEANTQRLYSRLIASTTHPSDRAANALLWEFAEQILPRRDCGRFNQAAMELGALLCTPKDPACPQCPLRTLCAAHEQGLERTIPGKVKNVEYEQRTEFALLVRNRQTDKYLVYRVPEGQRWAGLWDFPRFGPPHVDTVQAAAEHTNQLFDVQVTVGEKAKTIRHGVTKYRITLQAFHADADAETDSGNGNQQIGDRQWLSAEQLKALPLSVTGRKLAQYLAGSGRMA